jgi:hypothetical protein
LLEIPRRREGSGREIGSGGEATMEEKTKEKKQAEVTERATRRLLPTLPTRLLAKLWVTGRKRRDSDRARGKHLAGH